MTARRGASETALLRRGVRVVLPHRLLQLGEPDVRELLGNVVEPRAQVVQTVVTHGDQSASRALAVARVARPTAAHAPLTSWQADRHPLSTSGPGS